MTVAVLMTVFNRKEKTLQCLSYLFKNERSNIEIEVYLVDDHSSDGTKDAVLENYAHVHVIDGSGSLFWNRGMRTAWAEAARTKHDYYLWLNDDTTLMSDAIERLICASEESRNQSIIIGSTLDSPENSQFTYGGQDFSFKHRLISPDDKKMIPCATFNGNIVLIPAEIFNVLGFNDSFFHHSFGDSEYGLRATKSGFINYIAPGYYGYCKRNNPIPLFRRSCYGLVKRFK